MIMIVSAIKTLQNDFINNEGKAMDKENKRTQGQQSSNMEREELHQIIDLLANEGVEKLLPFAHIHLSAYPKNKDWYESQT